MPKPDKDEKQAHRRPTSQDVADLAGVSRTTVSFVVNNKSGGSVRLSDETRKRVQEAIETLGYRPSSAARTLRTQRSDILAVMIPRIEDLFFARLVAAIQDQAEKEGFDVLIYDSRNHLERERKFLDTVMRRSVDGLITQTFCLSDADVDRLVKAGVAVVVHGPEPGHPHADNVLLDEAQAVEEIVSYLIDEGHRRIGTIAIPHTMWTGRQRREGYVRALRAHGIEVDPGLIYEADYERDSASAGMQHLLALPDPPTAVFAANDTQAIGALLYAAEAGLSVPDDVAIAGFDDIPETTIVRPRLTTVRKDRGLLAVAAVEMLVQRIRSEEPLPARRRVLEHEIVIRDSA